MQTNDGIKARGRFRLQITEDGKVVGDSGWRKNQITNDGFNEYLVKNLADGLTGVDVTHITLGTGGVPNVTATTLPGEALEASKRATVTAASSSSSKTVRFTATFESSDGFVTTNTNISNVGLVNSVTSGSLFAGNTYASSTCASNQNVNCTYDVSFATS